MATSMFSEAGRSCHSGVTTLNLRILPEQILTPGPPAVKAVGNPVGEFHPGDGAGGDVLRIEDQAVGGPVIGVGYKGGEVAVVLSATAVRSPFRYEGGFAAEYAGSVFVFLVLAGVLL